MRTDNYDLFLYSLISFDEHGYRFQELSFDYHNNGSPSITTEYEDRFSKEGMPIYYVKCIKR